MIELKGFLTKDSLSEVIEEKVLGGSTYFDAMIEYADDCGRDVEELMPFVSQVILDKLRKSAIDIGLFTSDTQALDS